MRRTTSAAVAALMRLGVSREHARRWAQRYAAALPQLARISADDPRDAVTYAICWSAEEALDERSRVLSRTREALRLTQEKIGRVTRRALESEDPDDWRRALEHLQAGSELAARLEKAS